MRLPVVLLVPSVCLGCADHEAPPPHAVEVHEMAPAPGSTPAPRLMPLTVSVTPGSLGPTESTGPFDRKETALALGAVDVSSCKTPGGPTGGGHVTVTFSPNGRVVSAKVDQPPFAGTPAGACIAGQFNAMHIPPFTGELVTVGKAFVLN